VIKLCPPLNVAATTADYLVAGSATGRAVGRDSVRLEWFGDKTSGDDARRGVVDNDGAGSAQRGGVERDRGSADQAQLHTLPGKGGVEHPIHGGVEPVTGHRQQVVSAGDSLGR